MSATQRPYAIRELAADELDRLEHLWLSLHDHHLAISPELVGMGARTHEESWRRRRGGYAQQACDPDCFTLVAERDDELLGYAFVTVGSGYAIWDSGERMAELVTLAVVPSARGEGIGSRLLAEVCNRLGAQGIERMAIGVAAANEEALRLYERHGFHTAEVLLLGTTQQSMHPESGSHERMDRRPQPTRA